LKPFALLLACALLAPLAPVAQEPSPQPQEPSEDTQPAEPPGDAEPAEDAAPDEALEEPLTPKQEEAKRKAAERAAKREARKLKREEKKAREEAKQTEEDQRQAAKRSSKAAEQTDLGYREIEAGKYKAAADHFANVRELEGGRSFEAEMGLAHVELAQGNFAQATQLAQKAVQSTPNPVRKAEALTLAGNATLAARPLIDGDPDRPQPGSEMFADAAMRFYARAVELAPVEATEARASLDRRFRAIEPTPRVARLLDDYLSDVPDARRSHGERVARTYEALISGTLPAGPMAVVGPVSAPARISGPAPRVAGASAETEERVIVGLVIEPDGSVSSVDLLDRDDEAYDRAVSDALKQWTWEPARLPDGRAARVYWLWNVPVQPE
jgi:tetratricopeptide (TPR) repeat protein